jgi:drug/metabolite transporter (DMT)-like permease
MDTAPLRTAATQYHALRGWLSVPTGVLFIAAGLFNLPIGDEEVPASAAWFLLVLIAVGVAYYLINRYYVTTFGRARPTRRVQWQVATYTVLAAIAICVGITIDTNADLRICLYAVTFAASLLGYYAWFTGLRPHHVVCLGAVIVLGLLPIWGGMDDKVSVALIPMGVATIAVGLFDHRDLVRSMRAARAALVA